MIVQDPQTPEEWRVVAQMAAGLRLIEDARLYGFLVGGPTIDVERVDDVIDRARELGLAPTVDEAQQAALELAAEWGVRVGSAADAAHAEVWERGEPAPPPEDYLEQEERDRRRPEEEPTQHDLEDDVRDAS